MAIFHIILLNFKKIVFNGLYKQSIQKYLVLHLPPTTQVLTIIIKLKNNYQLIHSKFYEINILININKSGQFFGQGGFFSSAPRESSAKCSSTTHVLVLPQNKFIEALKDFPLDFEKFCQIKDEMVLYNKKESMACLSCGKYNHSLVNCHYIHYSRNRDLLIARKNYSVPNQRKEEYDRNQKKFYSIKSNDKVRSDLKRLRQDAIDKIYNDYHQEGDEDDTVMNYPIKNKINLIGILEDKKFFQKAKKIKYEDQKIIIISDDEDFDTSLDEIPEQSYHSSYEGGSDYQSEYDEDDIEEADIDEEEEVSSQNETQGKSIKIDDSGQLQEDNKSQRSKKHTQTNQSSGNIYVEKLNQFMIQIQKEGLLNDTSSIRSREKSKLGVSQLSPSITGSSYIKSNKNQSDSGSLVLQDSIQEASSSDSDKSQDYFRSRSESSPSHLNKNQAQKNILNIQPKMIKQNSTSTIQSKKKKNKSQNKKIINIKQKNNEGDKNNRENKSNSQTKREREKQQLKNEIQNLNQKVPHKKNQTNQKDRGSSYQQLKSNELNQDLLINLNNLKKNISLPNRNQQTSNQLINQQNQEIINYILNDNILKQLTDIIQNNQNAINKSQYNISQKDSSKNIKDFAFNSNTSIMVKNTNIHKKGSILDEGKQTRTSKYKSKNSILDQEASVVQIKEENNFMTPLTFKGNKSIQLETGDFNIDQNFELNNLQYQDELDDFNVIPSLSNILMVQNNQSFQETQSHSIPPKIDLIDKQNISPKINNGILKFGSQNYDEDSEQQTIIQKQNNLNQLQNQSQLLFNGIHIPNSTPLHIKDRSQSFASPSINNQDKQTNKYLQSKEMHYKSSKSKMSRDSKLFQVQENSENKIGSHISSNNQQNIGFSKFSAFISDQNPTPSSKSGLMDSRNADQESIYSIGGYTPSSKTKRQGNIQNSNSKNIQFFNFNNQIDDQSDQIHTPRAIQKQQSSPLYLQNSKPLFQSQQKQYQFQQQQQLQQPFQQQFQSQFQSQNSQQQQNHHFLNKKSKFAPNSNSPEQNMMRRTSITKHFNQEIDNNQINLLSNQYTENSLHGEMPNFDRIRKEQERIRRNSPLLLTKHPLSGISAPRNSSRFLQDVNPLRNQQSTSSFGQQGQMNIGNSNNPILNQNQNGLNHLNNNNNNNNHNHHSSTHHNQVQINEDIYHKIKELFLQKQQDDDKSFDPLTKRGSTMIGSEQTLFIHNTAYLDYNMFFIPDFDLMKEYESYFVYNNLTEVLKRFREKYKSSRRVQKVQFVKRKTQFYQAQSFLAISSKID